MSKRSIEALVGAIRQQMEGVETETGLFVALWCEGDSDAGYFLRADGTMFPAGDYQYGFTHLDQLLETEHESEARGEAGRIAGDIQPLTTDELEELYERLPMPFGVNHEVVEKAWADGKITAADVVDAYARCPGLIVEALKVGERQEVVLTQDLVVGTLALTEAGLEWTSHTVAHAEQTFKGLVHHAGHFAEINVEGGHLWLKRGLFKSH